MVRVETLTHNGMGRLPDGTLVPRVLPGEEIEVAEDGSARILTPSSDRVAPPCRHFKTCGGCAMQHASDDFVAAWKRGIVERALTAQGLDAPLRRMHTSPPRSRRRARLSARKTKKGALVGFHTRASDTIVGVPDCQLLLPSLTALLPALEQLTRLAASRSSEVNFTVTDSPAGADVRVETDRELDEALRAELGRFAQEQSLSRLVWNDEPIATIAPPFQEFGAARVVPPPGAFLQATREGEAALLASVQEAVAGAFRLVDLFSGCGTFTLPLAADATIRAVEGAEAMLDALDHGWRHATGLRPVTTEARDLFRRPLEPDELNRFDAAVIDPPRQGAEAQIARIAASELARVAMVSCNPVTFARDARALIRSGFRLTWVDIVDQFRWSPHVELAAQFTRS